MSELERDIEVLQARVHNLELAHSAALERTAELEATIETLESVLAPAIIDAGVDVSAAVSQLQVAHEDFKARVLARRKDRS